MAPGRNEPCPCGSGRKFKHCHGGAAATPSGPPTRIDREIAFDLIDHAAGLSRFADDNSDAIDMIWPYLSDDDDLDAMMDTPAGTLFLEWFQFDFVLHTGQTIAEHVLEKDAAQLTPGARRFLRACAQAPLRLLQVAKTEPGVCVHVKDLIDRGPTMAVSEQSGSRTLVRHDVFMGRVAEYDGERQFEGMTISVNILERIPLARAIRRSRRRLAAELPAGPVLARTDRETTGAILVGAVVDVIERGLPRLTTSDGDDLVFANAVFSVSDARAVRAALDAAPDVEAHAEDGEEGDGLARYSWYDAPRADRDAVSRVLGTVVLDGGRMRIETMSMARARRAEKRFSNLAGGALQFKVIDVKSVEAALNEPRPAAEPRDIDPDIAGPIERALLEDAYHKWLDESIPALDGRTPREAATIKRLRPMLIALVEGIENQAEHHARDRAPFDASFLRSELGLRRG